MCVPFWHINFIVRASACNSAECDDSDKRGRGVPFVGCGRGVVDIAQTHMDVYIYDKHCVETHTSSPSEPLPCCAYGHLSTYRHYKHAPYPTGCERYACTHFPVGCCCSSDTPHATKTADRFRTVSKTNRRTSTTTLSLSLSLAYHQWKRTLRTLRVVVNTLLGIDMSNGPLEEQRRDDNDDDNGEESSCASHWGTTKFSLPRWRCQCVEHAWAPSLVPSVYHTWYGAIMKNKPPEFGVDDCLPLRYRVALFFSAAVERVKHRRVKEAYTANLCAHLKRYISWCTCINSYIREKVHTHILYSDKWFVCRRRRSGGCKVPFRICACVHGILVRKNVCFFAYGAYYIR